MKLILENEKRKSLENLKTFLANGIRCQCICKTLKILKVNRFLHTLFFLAKSRTEI